MVSVEQASRIRASHRLNKMKQKTVWNILDVFQIYNYSIFTEYNKLEHQTVINGFIHISTQRRYSNA
jgi:hypothetical protein